MFGATDLTGAADVVQLALTPIFLLTGLASLLNVFTTRLGRIADRVDRLRRMLPAILGSWPAFGFVRARSTLPFY